MSTKIIRTICFFQEKYDSRKINKLKELKELFESKGYLIQTLRMCFGDKNIINNKEFGENKDIMFSIGSLNFVETENILDTFLNSNFSINLDLTNDTIEEKHLNILLKIITEAPHKTFNFTYTFNNSNTSPYFPSANYEKEGFSIGLQPTDLASDCNSLDEWFTKMQETWQEIIDICKEEKDFLGIDSSIAPLFEGDSSLIYFIKKLGLTFNESVLTDIYTKITKFIKEKNPKPVGLCGLMLPCLEDFELATEYENGNFDLERNIFLSLHSGLGIDTYPIGIDENKEKVLNILKLIQSLSNKYKKPLSIRFVSDGKAKIGDKTDFENQYLKDVIVRKV